MSTNNRISFRALKVLTYTVLSKAIIDALILISRMTDGYVLLTVAEAADFVSIVACMMCLGGVVTLSRKFDTVRKIMVIVLMLDCITLLVIMFEMRMIINNHAIAVAGFELIALVAFTIERLLIGAAFLFLMKGFGEILREGGDNASATASERLGTIYLCIISAAAMVTAFTVTIGRTLPTAASVSFALAGIILEFLMYRRVYDTARLLWKAHAVVTDEQT